ncbi:MAG: O-antigen ligase family protein [Methyloversatilis sp.]|nr:O-antigen ligase family protein [Methyloversatilis sp.]
MKKLPLVGSFFFLSSVLAFVFYAITDWYFHDLARLFQIMLALLSVFFLQRLRSEPSIGLWLISLCMLVLSVRSGRWGVIETLHILLLVFCVSAWSARLRQVPEPNLGYFLLLPAAAYLALILLPRWAALTFQGLSFELAAFFFGFENPRFFGHWVTLTLPLMVYLASKTAGPQMRHSLCWWVFIAFWVAFLIASGTRGSWLALVVVTALLPFTGSGGRRLGWGMIQAGLSGILAYLLLFVLLPWVAQGDVTAPGAERIPELAQLSKREVLWGLALDGIRSNVLFGRGPMTFSTVPNPVGAHPHNLFLQVAYEWGCIGAVALAVFMLRCGLHQLMKCRAEAGMERVTVMACIVAGVLQAQVDGVLVMPFSQTLFAFLCAWLISLDPAKESVESGYWSRLRMSVCAIFLLIMSTPEIRDLRAWEQNALASSGVNLYFPRFWAQGFVSY